MSMFSHPINVETKELKNELKNRKKPAPFSKKPVKKTSISKEIKESTAEALKEMIAKQKQEVSAASTFSAQLAQNLIFEASGTKVTALEPSVQVMQLFDKLVDALTHIHRDGITETSMILDGEAFSSSIFQGAKITITEYSTAPKVFNIQFSANAEALSFFSAHAADLSAALQKGNFGFEVNRIDTALFAEEKKLRKVESALEKEGDHE